MKFASTCSSLPLPPREIFYRRCFFSQPPFLSLPLLTPSQGRNDDRHLPFSQLYPPFARCLGVWLSLADAHRQTSSSFCRSFQLWAWIYISCRGSLLLQTWAAAGTFFLLFLTPSPPLFLLLLNQTEPNFTHPPLSCVRFT